LGISLFVFLNLIIITARVYKFQLGEVNFLSCFLTEIVSFKNIKKIYKKEIFKNSICSYYKFCSGKLIIKTFLFSAEEQSS